MPARSRGTRTSHLALCAGIALWLLHSAAAEVGSAWQPFLTAPAADTSDLALANSLESIHMAAPAMRDPSKTWLLADDSWTAYNDSQSVPLLPEEIAWLMEIVEQRLHNRSSLPLQLERAVTLAHYTSAVYCSPENIRAWNCSRCSGRAAEMQPFGTVYDPAWDLRAYSGWSPSMGAIIVAFRGTDSHSIVNWVSNMRYWRTDYSVPFPGATGAYVHTGFFLSYNASNLRPNVTDAVESLLSVHQGAPIYVVGHSMGAAVATLCALDLLFTFQLDAHRVRLYTYGSPRVGNDAFAAFVARTLPESIRVTHNRDIVPEWPPRWVGFHHIATEVWVIDISLAHVVTVCDGSGEDSACHNSVCWLGLCTSVSDHLHYMGAKMYGNRSQSC